MGVCTSTTPLSNSRWADWTHRQHHLRTYYNDQKDALAFYFTSGLLASKDAKHAGRCRIALLVIVVATCWLVIATQYHYSFEMHAWQRMPLSSQWSLSCNPDCCGCSMSGCGQPAP